MSKRICAIHGIWEHKKPRDRCPQCSKQTQKNYDTFRRDKGLTKFYSSGEWRKLREMQLKRDPLCVKCGRPATVADHIKEIKDGGEKLSLDNLQSMCNGCHTVKTAEEKKKRGSIG
jgi:5-methylcytosine-specific restriction endonuclease McrA